MVAAIYLMLKYKWNTKRTLEYMSIKKPDLEITTEILAAFQMLEKDLGNVETQDSPTKQHQSPIKIRKNWDLPDLKKIKTVD